MSISEYFSIHLFVLGNLLFVYVSTTLDFCVQQGLHNRKDSKYVFSLIGTFSHSIHSYTSFARTIFHGIRRNLEMGAIKKITTSYF